MPQARKPTGKSSTAGRASDRAGHKHGDSGRVRAQEPEAVDASNAAPPSTDDKARLDQADPFLATIHSSRRTAEAYGQALDRLAEFISSTGYANCTPEECHPFPVNRLADDILVRFHEWLIKARYRPATIDNYLAGVKRFLTWLDANDLLAPGFQVGKAGSRLSAARGNRRRPSGAAHDPDPELPRIVTYFDNQPLPPAEPAANKIARLKILRARAIVHTLYSSAGRVSEVASLTRRMVRDGRADEVRITGKGNKDRVILLTSEAQRAIREYLAERDDSHPGLFISHGRGAGKPLGRGTLWAVVKEAVNALGLYGGTSPHAFRHYRAQQLLHEGMDLDVLQIYLGHADISTTRRIYAPHTATAKVKDQLATFGRSAADVVRSFPGAQPPRTDEPSPESSPAPD